MSQSDWDKVWIYFKAFNVKNKLRATTLNDIQVSSAALELFKYGQEQAAKRGLLLVDTKYEFGKGSDGEIYLIDEVGF